MKDHRKGKMSDFLKDILFWGIIMLIFGIFILIEVNSDKRKNENSYNECVEKNGIVILNSNNKIEYCIIDKR